MNGSSPEFLSPRRSSARHTKLLTAAALGTLMAALPAQAELGEQAIGSAAPMSTSFYYQFPGSPRIAVSIHGNLLRYEGPTGYDHIGVGTVGEGYVLCYGGTQAYDVGPSETGFGPSSASCSGNTCTFTRYTLDGRLRLRQVLTKSPTERSLDVEMTLTNVSGSFLSGVILRRQVDFDVDTGGSSGTGNFVNWFGASERDSAFAWNAPNTYGGESHAMLLRHLKKTPTSVPYNAKVTSSILDTSCSPSNIAANGPVQGDYGATIQYNIGTLGQGSSFVGRVQYERN